MHFSRLLLFYACPVLAFMHKVFKVSENQTIRSRAVDHKNAKALSDLADNKQMNSLAKVWLAVQ